VSEREISQAEAVELLEEGELEVLGRMPWSSNQTYLGRLEHLGVEALVVYKPRRGERPLWDFPPGTLCQREVAAYAVSESLGWSIVPLTVLRDGPGGEGMVQVFIDHDPEQHYFTLRDEFAERFRQFALFDVVANNADRKAGHCLRANDGHIWGIDHGLSFHAAVKLRTVIWDYEGQPITEAELDALSGLAAALRGDLGQTLGRLLNRVEVDAIGQRVQWLLRHRVFPQPLTEYPYPWPMV
jgi:uncharacterized repeat protein (TIGR03843 family)